MNNWAQRTRSGFIAGVLAAGPLLISGCSSEPPKVKQWEIKAIPEDELEVLYTMAAKAAVDQLPPRDCIDPNLAPSAIVAIKTDDPNGWTTGFNAARYRMLADTRITTLPDAVQRILGKVKFKSGCERRLVFTKANVFETESEQGRMIQARIGIDYLCPLCSHGNAAYFIKRNGKWEMEPELVETFVS